MNPYPYSLFLCCIGLVAAWAGTVAAQLPAAGALTVDQAQAQALTRSPMLESASYHRLAAEARARQAGRFINPELEIAVEEYDRGGEGLDAAEAGISLGQTIELGGKRRARTRLAGLESERAGWDYERARLDVLTETRVRFTQALAAQQRAELARAAIGLAEQAARVVEERVKAGREPELQATKARAELALARMDALDARSDLATARRQLAAMWGEDEPAFTLLDGDLHRLPPSVPPLADLQERLALSPDLAWWDTERRMREAEGASARAARVPDLTASVGFQHFEEDGTEALAFGLGIPLPLFDRNLDEVNATAHDQARTQSAYRAAQLEQRVSLAAVHARLTSTHARATLLENQVVPAMEAAFAAAEEGYRQGKLGYLDVLDAQRSLTQVRQEQLDALADYHRGVADMDRLTSPPQSHQENRS